jgi:hypothetical protein
MGWTRGNGFFLFLILSSCGYRSAQLEERPTISIPYVQGDIEGMLTAAIVRELASRLPYEYRSSGGALRLDVKLIQDQQEKVGYRYNRNTTTGKIEKNLMPTESRRTASAEVTLTRLSTEEKLFGPEVITANVDFDYDDVNAINGLSFIPEGQTHRQTTLRYSLGQVDSIEGAQDDAATPLYRQLAEKISSRLLEGNLSQ